MIITEIKTEFILATLQKGTRVTMCDYSNNRMFDCGEMTVNSILAFAEKDTIKFFSVKENEQT
jgi:hypothetical protein